MKKIDLFIADYLSSKFHAHFLKWIWSQMRISQFVAEAQRRVSVLFLVNQVELIQHRPGNQAPLKLKYNVGRFTLKTNHNIAINQT